MDTRLSVNTTGFGPRSVVEFLPELAAHGIDRVGLAMAQLEEGDLPTNQRALRDAGLQVTCTVAPIAFTLSEPAAWPAERDRLQRYVEVSAEVGAPVLYTTTGPIRDLLWDEAANRFVEAIAPVAARGQEAGVRLAIENTTPMRADLGFVHLLDDTVELARRAGVGVCADLFAAWTDRDLRRELIDGVDDFALVQIADFVLGTLCAPGRAVPGDGDIPIARQLGWLAESGYRGPVELELLGPRIEAEGPAAAAARAVRVVSTLLAESSA